MNEVTKSIAEWLKSDPDARDLASGYEAFYEVVNHMRGFEVYGNGVYAFSHKDIDRNALDTVVKSIK